MNLYLIPGAMTARRKRLGIKAKDLAARVGVSPATVSLWASGQRAVTPDRQRQLAAILGGRRGLFVAVPSQPKNTARP